MQTENVCKSDNIDLFFSRDYTHTSVYLHFGKGPSYTNGYQ